MRDWFNGKITIALLDLENSEAKIIELAGSV